MSEQSGREIEQAFQMLECCGVPRERAKTVSNGIDVLSTRCQKEANGLAYDIAALKSQRDELLAAAKDMLADLDSFDGPEKFIDGEYPHFSPSGRVLDMKHAARFRAAIANAEAPSCD